MTDVVGLFLLFLWPQKIILNKLDPDCRERIDIFIFLTRDQSFKL